MEAYETYDTCPRNQILLGRSEMVLKGIPSNSVDAIVCDPPYGLGSKEPTIADILAYIQGGDLNHGGDFMGKDWEIPSVECWRECFRVLKPGGHLLAFAGTRTFDLMALGIRAAGFESRDTIASEFGVNVLQWMHGQGFPKSLNVAKEIDRLAGVDTSAANWTGPVTDEAKEWEGWGTALKPAWEPILVYRKPVEAGTIAEQVLATGTGALNIDATRIRHASEKDLAAHQQNVAAIKDQGGTFNGSWKNSSDLAGANDVNTAGRWPPNVVMVHSDACKQVGERRVKGRTMVTFDEGMKPFGDAVGAKHTATPTVDDVVPVYACALHCPVKLLDEQSGISTSTGGRTIKRSGGGNVGSGKKSEKVVTNDDPGFGDKGGASRFFPQFEPLDAPFLYTAKVTVKEATLDGLIDNDHPTRKPLKIMQWLVRLVCAKGGLVLDPFCGSGTTLCAATLEGMDFFGIDMDTHFVVDIARPRTAHYLAEREDADGQAALLANFGLG